jgi:hypothetical protein
VDHHWRLLVAVILLHLEQQLLLLRVLVAQDQRLPQRHELVERKGLAVLSLLQVSHHNVSLLLLRCCYYYTGCGIQRGLLILLLLLLLRMIQIEQVAQLQWLVHFCFYRCCHRLLLGRGRIEQRRRWFLCHFFFFFVRIVFFVVIARNDTILCVCIIGRRE